MEDGVNFPSRRKPKAESCAGDDFFHFKWAGLFHLELFGSIHVEVGCFEPDFVSHLPGGEFSGYLFSHLLLSHFVGSLGIISSGG